MPAFSGQLVLAAAARQLSDIYGTPPAALVPPSPGNQRGLAMVDVPMRQVLFIAEGADGFIGADANVTASAYGVKVDSTENVPVSIGPFDNGGIKLSDLWVAGNGCTLHVLGIEF